MVVVVRGVCACACVCQQKVCLMSPKAAGNCNVRDHGLGCVLPKWS